MDHCPVVSPETGPASALGLMLLGHTSPPKSQVDRIDLNRKVTSPTGTRRGRGFTNEWVFSYAFAS